MAIKNGVSHSFATLLLTLISALLIGYLKYIGMFEVIFDYMDLIFFNFSNWLAKFFDIEISYEIFIPVFVASVLASIWGIIFHIARYRRKIYEFI